MKILYIIISLSILFFTTLSVLDKGNVSYYHPKIDGVERSGGAADVLGQDRTGGPVSVGTCTACHSGGSYATETTIQLLNEDGDAVTSYVPGDIYTLNITVLAGAGSPAGYGSQTVALREDNTQGGTFGSATTANTQNVSLSGRTYLEHEGFSTSGSFSAPWTAPTIGAGTITFYGIGMAVNGGGSTSGDLASSPVSLEVIEEIGTTFTYDGGPSFCSNEEMVSPTIDGETGGTFSADAGLDIDSETGAITFSTSLPGLYTITYNYGEDEETTYLIQILESFETEAGATICEGETLMIGDFVLSEEDEGINELLLTASNGCDSLVTLTLSVSDLPEIAVTSDDDAICLGDEVTFSVTGDEATYSWDEDGITEGTPYEPTAVGTFDYTVTATSVETGCESSETISVTVNEVTLSATVIDADDVDNGSIDLTVTGGTPSYTFDWDNDESGDFDDTEDLTDLTGGTYTVTVLDSDDCEATAEYIVGTHFGIGDENLETILLYPNPVSDYFNLVLPNEFTYTLTNAEGKVMLTGTGNELAKVRVTELPKATYFVTVLGENTSKTFRVVKN